VISIDDNQAEIAAELRRLVQDEGIEGSTAAVGSIWDALPVIYAISYVYCTPSIMEGFGMSVQEAAATRVPIIASNLVPFVTEYLAAGENEVLDAGSAKKVLQGKGAIIVEPDDIEGFTFALDRMLSNEDLRNEMGENAYQITIANFTWDHIVEKFIEVLDQSEKTR
jgi:glycosyltransferase involved in cell wall biosynthesis